MNQSENDSELPKHRVKAVIIASENGIPLVSVKVDDQINESLIAPFFSALRRFSEENLDALNETLIKGGKLETLVVRKYGLFLIALMDKHMKKIKIGKEAEQALDLFYKMYKQEIDNLDETCLDLEGFKKFEVLLKRQIKQYYKKIDGGEGFFSRLMNFFRKNKDELR
ncbi:MAG: roadblock/LC7 domain-containing protein [Promethearchaeia archaeon]